MSLGYLQPPPYPAETTSLGFRLKFDLERIFLSDEWTLMDGEQRAWWLMAFSLSWLNTPAGSISENDPIIASHIPKKRLKSKRGPLFGWTMHADGRLYYPIMTDAVLSMVRRRSEHEGWREIRSFILRRDENTCQYCGRTEGVMHVDHVIPRSRGGLNDPGNLVAACPACNLSKSSKTPEEWRRSYAAISSCRRSPA